MENKRKSCLKSDENSRMAESLLEACARQNLSVYGLAKLAEVPLTTIMHILNGSTQNPGFYTIAKLCGVLGISMDELARGGPEEKGMSGTEETDEDGT